jgi:hypothetical protein
VAFPSEKAKSDILNYEGGDMAEHGEWNRQGRSLSDVTAAKEYGISHDFILQGIRSGNLEYRQGVMFGNSYLKILRNQLEQYIAEQLGSQNLGEKKAQAELRSIKREIGSLKRKLAALEARKAEIESR